MNARYYIPYIFLFSCLRASSISILERKLNEAKMELDRIVMDANGLLVRRAKRDSQLPSITFGGLTTNDTEFDGNIYKFHEILVLKKDVINRIDIKLLQPFVVFCEDCVDIKNKHVTFIEMIKRHELMFFVIGMRDGETRLFSTRYLLGSSPANHNYKLLQKINPPRWGHYPVDGKFVTASGQLFFYLAYQSLNGDLSESILFRFRGSYLDEENNKIFTDGCKSVATFSSGASQIIVVAQASDANRKISSQVLRLSNAGKKLEKIQLLGTRKPMNVKHFRAFGGDFLFVCERSSPSTIYWWKGGEFMKWLDLDFIYGNCSFFIQQINDEKFLISTLKDETTIYSLGWKHIKQVAKVPRLSNDTQKIINLSVSTENITRLYIVGVFSNVIRFSIWNLELHASNFTDSNGAQAINADPLMECLTKAEEDIGGLGKRINDTHELVNNQLIHLNENLSINKITVLNGDSSVRMNSGTAGRVNYLNEMSEKEIEIDELLMASEKLIESTIDRTILTFNSTLTIKEAVIKSASAFRVNNMDLSSKNFIWLEKIQQLEALSANEIRVNSLLSDVLGEKRIGDLILKNSLNDKPKLFIRNLTCNNIFITNNKINNFSLEKIVLKDNNKTIHGKKIFDKVEAGVIFTRMDDKYIQADLNSANNSDHESLHDINSNSLNLEDNAVVENLNVHKINDEDISALVERIAFNGVDNAIKSGVTYEDDVRVELLKGTRLSQPISSVRRSTTNSNAKEINSEKVMIGDDDCRNESQMSEVDGSYKDNNQKMRSIIQPRAHELVEDVKIKGNVKAKVFICKNCKVYIQNQSFPIDELGETFWTYNSVQNITVPTVVDSSITVDAPIQAGKINGKELSCFLDRTNDRNFKPRLHFNNVTVLGDILDSSDSSHNGFKARELNDSVVRSSETQYITDKKNFSGGISVNQLKAGSLLESSPTENISSRSMRKSSDQSDDRPFKFVVNGDLIVKEDLDILQINGIDIGSTIEKAAFCDENTDFQSISFKNLIVNNLDIKYLNGKNFDMIINPPRTKTRIDRAYINGNIEPLLLSDVNHINNINIHEELPKIVNSTGEAIVRGHKKFKSNLIVENNVNAKLINNHNIHEIYINSLSKRRDQSISGKVTIKQNASMKSLQARNVNGVDTSNLIDISNSDNITFNSNVVFKKLTVLGNVKIADSCNPSQEEGRLTLKGRKHWKNLRVFGNISWNETEKSYGEIEKIFNKAVTLDGKHKITGSVIFQKDLSIKEVSHINNTISGINLTHIMKDSLMKNKDNQIITGEKIFMNHVYCNILSLATDLLANYVNQENILEFNRTLVRKHFEGMIEGHKYFERGFKAFSLKTKGGINGIPMSDIVLTDSNRTLPQTIFEDLEIIMDLDIEKYNSMNFEEFLEERFLISKGANQVFNGSLSFESDVILEEESFVNLLNNITIDNIVLNEGNSYISSKTVGGCKVFSQPLQINGRVNTKLFNNKDLHSLNKCSVSTDESATIKGNIVFEDNVVLNDELWAESYFIEGIGVNITSALEEFQKPQIQSIN